MGAQCTSKSGGSCPRGCHFHPPKPSQLPWPRMVLPWTALPTMQETACTELEKAGCSPSHTADVGATYFSIVGTVLCTVGC